MLEQTIPLSTMSFGEAWLENIEIDIEKKYSIKNPIFLINRLKHARDYLCQWCNNVLFESRWIKYKHISENIFQLKSFFPDPPVEVCKKIINEELDELQANNLNKSNLPYEFCGEIYNIESLKRELLYSLLSGYSDMEFYLLNQENKSIITVCASSNVRSEMHPWLQNGYLSLEYHDN